MAGTPEMQKQFPAGAWTARHPESGVILAGPTCRKCTSNFRQVPGPHESRKRSHFGPTDMPEMHEQFPAGARTARHPENEVMPAVSGHTI
jgi:hypothetical protein